MGGGAKRCNDSQRNPHGEKESVEDSVWLDGQEYVMLFLELT